MSLDEVNGVVLEWPLTRDVARELAPRGLERDETEADADEFPKVCIDVASESGSRACSPGLTTALTRDAERDGGQSSIRIDCD